MEGHPFLILISQETQRNFFPIKIICLIFSFFLFGMIIHLLRATDWLKYSRSLDLKEFKDFKAIEASAFAKKWKKTKKRLAKKWEGESKLAIIEADDLLGEVLGKKGYQGEDLEQGLREINKASLLNIKELEQAREVRDNIVSNPDYKIDLNKAKKIIEIYEQTFKSLNLL